MAVLGMTLSSENKRAGPAALYSQPRGHLSYEMGGWEGGRVAPRLKIREILAV